ncbi:MAG: MarR family transcriptional regulator [Acidimicrobiales bacterium]|nr:MarR family transcriptional regulator [Acidimicrobiales bacterium]
MAGMQHDLAVLDDPRVEAFGMLLETHNETLNAVTQRLDDTSIPVPWIGVLVRLARTPGHRLRMSELAHSMTMSTSGLTRLVDRLEDAGHVRREPCPDDRRGTWALLTEEGRQRIESLAPGHVQDLGELLGDALSDPQLEQLTTLLRKVRDHIRSLPAR